MYIYLKMYIVCCCICRRFDKMLSSHINVAKISNGEEACTFSTFFTSNLFSFLTPQTQCTTRPLFRDKNGFVAVNRTEPNRTEQKHQHTKTSLKITIDCNIASRADHIILIWGIQLEIGWTAFIKYIFKAFNLFVCRFFPHSLSLPRPQAVYYICSNLINPVKLKSDFSTINNEKW